MFQYPGSSIKNNVLFLLYSLPNIGQNDKKSQKHCSFHVIILKTDIFMGNSLLNGQNELCHGLYWFGFILSLTAFCDHCDGNVSSTTWIWTLDPTLELH